MDEEQLEEKGVSLHTGFPNAAVGSSARSLDLTKLLIKHPAATYLMQLDSDEWLERGMATGDTIIIDRSLKPRKTDTVIWSQHGQFMISSYKDTPEDTEIWGVVSAIIHRMGRS